MLVKLMIDGEEREIKIKRITMRELQRELIPEIESRLKELSIMNDTPEKSDGLDQSTIDNILGGKDNKEAFSFKKLLSPDNMDKAREFVFQNVSYVQSKLVKHTNLSQDEIEELSPAETIALLKVILILSFGKDLGKLLIGLRSLLQSLIAPAVKQMM